MEVTVLTGLPFTVDAEDAAARLKLDEVLREEFDDILAEALAVANPKMLYGRADVTLSGDSEVTVGGMSFKSRVLWANMREIAVAYPYVATCGRELHDLAQSKDDPLERYWVEFVSELILREGLAAGLTIIRGREETGTLYAMNPGSLPDWPISQQRPLFALLGDVMDDIGVELTESCLMMPVKSVSGLLFQSEKHYTNCSLCPREGCPNRRDPYNPDLEKEYGIGGG